MPVFKKKTADDKTDEWYIDVPNKSSRGPPVYTLQVEPEGRDFLLGLDLDHDAADNRAADIEWSIFHSLNDLGLLFTYDTDYEPTDVAPSSDTFKSLDKLSPNQQKKFAHSLLDAYELNTLFQHEHVQEFFLSLSSLDEYVRCELLSKILRDTPFDPMVIEHADIEFDQYMRSNEHAERTPHNPFALALFLVSLYDSFTDSEALLEEVQNESHVLWVWEDWVAVAGGELLFHGIQSDNVDSVPERISDYLVQESDSVRVSSVFNLLEHELSALCCGQTVRAMNRSSKAIGWAAQARFEKTGHCMIVPRPDSHTAPLPEHAIEEASDW